MVTKFVITALFSVVAGVSYQSMAHADITEVDVEALLLEMDASGASEFVPGSLTEDEVRAESGLPSSAECENNPLLKGCYEVVPTSGETVQVEVSLGLQQLSVYVSGNYVGTYLISSGKPGHGTPVGSFKVWEANATKRSSKYENAPMPLALAFTPRYHALHCGNVTAKRASHGCVRVERAGCEKLWELQKTYGFRSFDITISDSNPNVASLEDDNRPYYGQSAKSTASNTKKAKKSSTAVATATAKKSSKNQQMAAANVDIIEEDISEEPKPKKKKKKFKQRVSDIVDGFFGMDDGPY